MSSATQFSPQLSRVARVVAIGGLLTFPTIASQVPWTRPTLLFDLWPNAVAAIVNAGLYLAANVAGLGVSSTATANERRVRALLHMVMCWCAASVFWSLSGEMYTGNGCTAYPGVMTNLYASVSIMLMGIFVALALQVPLRRGRGDKDTSSPGPE